MERKNAKKRYSPEQAIALDKELTKLAAERGISKLELIRQSLALYAIPWSEARPTPPPTPDKQS
jgi:hypothetical protein